MEKQGTTQSGDVELAWTVRGSGQPTILLINGLGSCSQRWGEQYPNRLAENHTVVLVDNRGTGGSSKPTDPWTLEDMAADAMAVLDDLGIEKAHVIGISMGGMIAQLVALDHRARVDRLVLMATHFGGSGVVLPSPEVMATLNPPKGKAPADVIRDAVIAIAAPGYAEANPEVVDRLVEIGVSRPTPFSAFRNQLQALIASDRSGRVSSIDAPTLVIHGDLDPLIPYANGEQLSERIPGSRLCTLQGCGHLPMWEMPDPLSKATLEFLAA